MIDAVDINEYMSDQEDSSSKNTDSASGTDNSEGELNHLGDNEDSVDEQEIYCQPTMQAYFPSLSCQNLTNH